MDEVMILMRLIFDGVEDDLLLLQISSLLFWGEWWLLHCVSRLLAFTKRLWFDKRKAAPPSMVGQHDHPRPCGCPLKSRDLQDEFGLKRKSIYFIAISS
jgi:hypothetical protein